MRVMPGRTGSIMNPIKCVILSVVLAVGATVVAAAAGFKDVEIVQALKTGEALGTALEVDYTVTPGKSASQRVLKQAQKKAFDAGMMRIAIVGIEASGEETFYARGVTPAEVTRVWTTLDGGSHQTMSGPQGAMRLKTVSVKLTVREVVPGP